MLEVTVLLLVAFVFLQTTAFNIYSVFMLASFMKRIRRYRAKPQRLSHYPGISVITSIRGLSSSLENGLRGIVEQDYPGPIEFVIAIENRNDAAYSAARKILAKRPQHIEVKWITDFVATGGNPRTAKMAYAAQYAKYPWIYWLAADTFERQDHLRIMMEKTRLDFKTYVSALPIHFGGKTLGALLETVPLLWEVPMFALLCEKLKRPFVYGGSILFHMRLLQESGGFAPILNYLTEEVPLSDSFSKVGGKCQLAPSLVWVRQDEQSVAAFYQRKVRWAMIGKYHHRELFYSGFVFSSMWMPVAWFVTGNPLYLGLLVAFLGIKSVVILSYQVMLAIPQRQWKWSLLIFPYEFINFVYCVHALFKREVNWAGDVMDVSASGLVTRRVAQ